MGLWFYRRLHKMRTTPGYFKNAAILRQYEVSTARTVARIPMRTTPVPVSVGTVETNGDDSYEDGGFEVPETTTVTGMATPRCPISATVDAFEACPRGRSGWGDTL